jgi:hypothetical protein
MWMMELARKTITAERIIGSHSKPRPVMKTSSNV